MKFGYARVSSKDQNPERQLESFRKLGIEERNIFIDKESGGTFNRTFYNLLVGDVNESQLFQGHNPQKGK